MLHYADDHPAKCRMFCNTMRMEGVRGSLSEASCSSAATQHAAMTFDFVLGSMQRIHDGRSFLSGERHYTSDLVRLALQSEI